MFESSGLKLVKKEHAAELERVPVNTIVFLVCLIFSGVFEPKLGKFS